jgi:hypothetical protein
MSQYFHLATGLRGCYMPDTSRVIRVDTRRELRDVVLSELHDLQEAGFILSKREAVTTVADIWRNLKAPKRSPYSFVVPYGWRHSRGHGVNKCNAIQIGHATRAEYLEQGDD